MMFVLKCLVRLALVLGALATGLYAAAIWSGAREVDEVSVQARQQSFLRARQWVLLNEVAILTEGNAALWWMLNVTAERMQDPALQQLVQRYLRSTYVGPQAQSPWRRLVDPGASFELPAQRESLEPYQNFFLHAATCKEVSEPDGTSSAAFLSGNVCRPMLTKVWLTDRVCSTHQLMGLSLFKQSGCRTEHDLGAVERSLVEDVRAQMWWSPVVQDAYIQRVLVLKWFSSDGRVEPVWLRRIIDSQQADGGWAGGKRFPELPQWAQPWRLRQSLLAMLGQSQGEVVARSDFHASAQGLLLMALTLRESP